MLETIFRGARFERNPETQGTGAVISWWESRRIYFNAVVGCTGVITCVLMLVCALVAEPTVGEPIGLPDGPLLGVFGILLHGILANICYTGGWIAELLLRSISETETATTFGLRAFHLGVKFSVALTLFPAVICWIILGVALISGHKVNPSGK